MNKKKVKISKIIKDKDLDLFITLSGDNNPIHVDKFKAKKYNFKGRVVHGALLISYFSKIIGTKLPGKNSLILFSEYKFHNPAFLNEKIIFTVKIMNFSVSTKTYELELMAKFKKKLIMTGKVVSIKL